MGTRAADQFLSVAGVNNGHGASTNIVKSIEHAHQCAQRKKYIDTMVAGILELFKTGIANATNKW